MKIENLETSQTINPSRETESSVQPDYSDISAAIITLENHRGQEPEDHENTDYSTSVIAGTPVVVDQESGNIQIIPHQEINDRRENWSFERSGHTFMCLDLSFLVQLKI